MSSGKILKCSCGRLNELDMYRMANCSCGVKHKHQGPRCLCGFSHGFIAKCDSKDITFAETGDDPSIVNFVFDDSTTLPVVKQFLCQDSPVFKEMLSNVNFKEASQNEVKLPGKSVDTFCHLVYFCYTRCFQADLLLNDYSMRPMMSKPTIFQLQKEMFEYAVEYQMEKLMDVFIKVCK